MPNEQERQEPATSFSHASKKGSFAKLMELIIFIAALCVVGVLAVRFGYDSRPTAHSKEQDLASLGLSRDQAGATIGDTRREATRLRSDHSNKRSPASQPIWRAVTRVLHALAG